MEKITEQAMSAAAVQQMNVWEQKYYDITELYALNEELMETVELAANPEAQLEIVAPLIETLGEATEVLTEEYVALCEGSSTRTAAKSKIEANLRKVYVAIHDYQKRVRETKNAAMMVVKKIKRQLEQVIANFVEFVTLSLDRVMQKQDIEELNAHHASIALMLHSVGQGQ